MKTLALAGVLVAGLIGAADAVLQLALGRQAVYNPYSARQFRRSAIPEVRDT